MPNDFSVELSDSDLERLAPYDNAMARDLADQLQDHADAQGYVFPGPVHIAFEAAEDLTTGRFRIRSRAAGLGHRRRPPHPAPHPAGAAGGQRHLPPAAPARAW